MEKHLTPAPALSFLFLFLFFSTTLYSQITIPEVTDPSDYNKDYIEYPENRLSLRLYGVNKYNLLHARMEDSKPLRYAPNAGWGFGVAAFYKTIGIWAGYSFPFLSPIDKEKGKTRKIDLQLNIYKRKFGLDLYLQSYKGYYLENPGQVISTPVPAGFIVRPDLKTLAIGGNYIRVFNPKKFSLPSGFIHSEIQKKSAGSFVLKPSVSFFSIQADSSLFPSEYSNIPRGDNFVKGFFTSLTISPGYIHNFVYKRFYLTLGLLPGGGIQYKHYTTDNGAVHDQVGFTLGVMGRAGLGYSNKKFFIGLSAVTDIYNIPLKDMSVQYRVGHLRAFVGYRFNEKGFFKIKKKQKK